MNADQLKGIRKTIINLFRSFSINPHFSPLKKQKDREIAGRFVDRLHSTTFDESRLPYYSKNGLAKLASKVECVFAMMSDIVTSYWALAREGDIKLLEKYSGELNEKMCMLDRVYHDFNELKVLGDVKGYCLLASLRKDLYGSKKEKQPATKEVSPEKTDEGIDSTDEREKAQVIHKRCNNCEGSGLAHDDNGCEIDDVCEECDGSGSAIKEDE
jgi:hypothetical protein